MSLISALKASRRIPEKYLWPFWGAAIALAFAHMYFQSIRTSSLSPSRRSHLLLEKLETKTTSLESDLDALSNAQNQSPQIATQIVELQVELQDLNDQILETYVGSSAKKEHRPLEKRVEALEQQVKALVQTTPIKETSHATASRGSGDRHQQ